MPHESSRSSSQRTPPQTPNPILLDPLPEQLQARLPSSSLLRRLERVNGGESHPERSGGKTGRDGLDEYWPSERSQQGENTGIGGGIAEAR